jgi:hypothetical protein
MSLNQIFSENFSNFIHIQNFNLHQIFSERKSKNILLGIPSKLLFLTFKTDLNSASRAINLNGVGSYSIEMSKNSPDNKIQLFEFGIDLSNICVESSKMIFSKIIRISPRYVLVNRTNVNLEIVQDACHKEVINIKPEERKHFFWSDVNKKFILRLIIYFKFFNPMFNRFF